MRPPISTILRLTTLALVALPAIQPAKASALVYQNAGAFIGTLLKQLPADVLSQLPKDLLSSDPKPNVLVATADETSIRATTGNSPEANAGVALIVAAIAIPNLLRARMAANESAAAP